MGSQSIFPAPTSVAVYSRRELAEIVADSSLEENLFAVTVQLRIPVPYSDLLVLARLSAAVQDCTPPDNEHVGQRPASMEVRLRSASPKDGSAGPSPRPGYEGERDPG